MGVIAIDFEMLPDAHIRMLSQIQKESDRRISSKKQVVTSAKLAIMAFGARWLNIASSVMTRLTRDIDQQVFRAHYRFEP